MTDFEAFWAVYPRRVAKPVAEKALAKALRRTSLGVILMGVERLVGESRELKFVPYPATWLNQGRYLDESPAPPQVVEDPYAWYWECWHKPKCGSAYLHDVQIRLGR